MEELIGYSLSPQQQMYASSGLMGDDTIIQVRVKTLRPVATTVLKESFRSVCDQESTFKVKYVLESDSNEYLQIPIDDLRVEFEERTELPKYPFESQGTKPGTEEGPLLVITVCPSESHTDISLTTLALCCDEESLLTMCRMAIDTVTGKAGEYDIISYLQYSEWQRGLLSDDDSRDSLQWWQSYTFGLPGAPQNRLVTSLNTSEKDYTEISLSLGSELLEIARNLAAKSETGIASVWTSALYLAFSRLNDGRPFSIASLDSGRSFDELNHTIGLMEKPLPFYMEVNENDTVQKLLSTAFTRTEELDTYKEVFPLTDTLAEHADYLQYALKVSLPGVENPFTLEHTSRGGGFHIIQVHIRYTEENRADIVLSYDRKVVSETAAQIIASSITGTLQSLTTVHTVGEVSCLGPDMETTVLNSFSGKTNAHTDVSQTLLESWDHIAAQYPDNLAIEDKKSAFTYSEIDRLANLTAQTLISQYNIGRGDKVIIFMQGNCHMVQSMLAVLKAGATYVPVDAGAPYSHLSFIVNDAACRLILTTSDIASDAIIQAEVCYVDNISEEEDLEFTLPVRPWDAEAYCIYTSGTTGKPKGTRISDASLMNYISWFREEFSIGADDVTALLSSFAFDLGYTSLWGGILSGSTVYLADTELIKNPEGLTSFVLGKGITFLKTTPSLLHIFLMAGNSNELGQSKLRLWLIGGEAIHTGDLIRMSDLVPDIQLVNHYGPSETTIGTIFYPIPSQDLRTYETRPVIGRPVTNNHVYILNETLKPVMPGQQGQIAISGRGLSKGYLNREALTLEKFIDNPFEQGHKMYLTGDLGYFTEEGLIGFLGRKDDQVKIRGYRVELDGVKSRLLELEGIAEAAVVSRQSGDFGNEIVAYLVGDRAYDTQQLRTELQAKVPDYMVPSHIVGLESMPLTANGKVDKKRLPQPEDVSTGGPVTSAETSTQASLLAIWKEIFANENIGIKDGFFDLGGHSLRAIQMASLISEKMGITVDLREIFTYDSVETLAGHIDQTHDGSVGKETIIEPLPLQEYYALSHAQKRIWLVSQQEQGSVAYNVPSAFEVSGKVTPENIKNAFIVLVQRYEILRTIFLEVKGEPVQKVLSEAPAEEMWSFVNLEDNSQPGEAIKQSILAEYSHHFEMDEVPPVRLSMLKISEDRNVIILNIHHILSDGWSRALLSKDFLEILAGMLSGTTSVATGTSVQFKDYIPVQNQAIKDNESFWKKYLATWPAPLSFPIDHARPEKITFKGKAIHTTLDRAEYKAIQDLAQKEGTTVNNIFLSLYGLLLRGYTGEENIPVGVISSGRNHSQILNTPGLFINYLPLNISVPGGIAYRDYLSQFSVDFQEVLLHDSYPYDLMVEQKSETLPANRNPLFDTMLIFHNEQELHEDSINELKKSLPGGIEINPVSLDMKERGTKLDFKVDIGVGDDRLSIQLEYNTMLLEDATAQDILNRYVSLINNLADQGPEAITTNMPSSATDKLVWKKKGSYQFPEAKSPLRITASFTAEPLQDALAVLLEEFQLPLYPEFAPYHQVIRELSDLASGLHAHDGKHVLLVRLEDYIRENEDGDKAKIEILQGIKDQLCKLISTHSTDILLYLFPVSSGAPHSQEVRNTIVTLNNALASDLASLPYVSIVRAEEINTSNPGLLIEDVSQDKIGHIPFTEEYYIALAGNITRQLYGRRTSAIKAIAVDCDNTLWKGVCGEDKPEAMVITPGHRYMQQFLLQKKKEGFLILLLSKNHEEDVWNVFRQNPDMVLTEADITDYRINWESKAVNISSLAEDLNIGVDSFVFLDDNPVEVKEMLARRQEVFSLQVPEERYLEVFLNRIWGLDKFDITEEDSQRSEMYRAEKARRSLKSEKEELNEYLADLKLEISFNSVGEEHVSRISQLTQRTNQFNLSTIRRTEEEVRSLIHKTGTDCYKVHVRDRFGDYGITGLVITKIQGEVLLVDTFLLSCRVLGRNVEQGITWLLSRICHENGLKEIKTSFIPTAKNTPAYNYLTAARWELTEDTVAGKLFRLDPLEVTRPLHIDLYFCEELPARDKQQNEDTAGEVLFYPDHTGVAVRNMQEAVKQYRSLGYTVSEPVFDPLQKVMLAMCELPGHVNIELVSPAGENEGPLYNILDTDGEGPYHLCYRVKNFNEALAAFEKANPGYDIILKPTAAILFHGLEVMFIYHQNTGLIELLQDPGMRQNGLLAGKPFVKLSTPDISKTLASLQPLGYYTDSYGMARAVSNKYSTILLSENNDGKTRIQQIFSFTSRPVPHGDEAAPAYIQWLEESNSVDYQFDEALYKGKLLLHFMQYKGLYYSDHTAVNQLLQTRNTTHSVRGTYESAEGDTEQRLQAIWGEVLKQEDVGVTSEFASLGGHSLRATQVLARIYREFGVEIGLTEFFRHDTIRKLAELVSSRQPASKVTSIPVLPVAVDYEASHAQKRLWVIQQMNPVNTAYNLYSSYELTGTPDTRRLEKAIEKVIARHEPLRTAFKKNVEGELRQVIADHTAVGFKVMETDMTGHETEEVHAYLQQCVDTPFDLSTAPLFRVELVKTGDEKYILLYVIHHIISDGWSLQVMFNEVMAIYNSPDQVKPEVLATLHAQYKDFASWSNNRLSSGKLDDARSFWMNKYATVPEKLNIKTDFARPEIRSFEGNTIRTSFSEEVIDIIRKESLKHGVSAYTFLLSAVAVLFHKYAKQENMVIGIPSAGRVHRDLEPLIGFFVNTLALRFNIKRDLSVSSLLEEVKTELSTSLDHQEYPFDMLVNDLDLSREERQMPLFNVMVQMLDFSNVRDSQRSMEGLKIETYEYPKRNTSLFELRFTFHMYETEIYMDVEYNTSLFKESRITRLITHLEQVIKGFADPDKAIGKIQHLTEAEQNMIMQFAKGN
ncbi:amino acid adenylation domain-containing protein [Roseivirga sp. BDSF3-8]|uniref:amino acid adenylation domain-containing protein n=1 Tax=Roseivirga sp. BDSF3-8 TaxID=3241598 RepID=UPI003531BB9E